MVQISVWKFDFSRNLLSLDAGVCDVFCSEKYKRRRFVRSGYSVGRRDLPRVLFTVILPGDSRRFRPPFFTIEVALDSSREAISPYTHFGGCCWLEQKLEATVIRPCVGAFSAEGDMRLSSVVEYEDCAIFVHGGRNKSGEEAAARGWPTAARGFGREERRWAAVFGG
ncbi:hypothetical protein F511_36557 [Dorcoceras hygrometricum]|uniref:Uncharacterized protein n=1 Tax=Dorcoceras hygrometricum TaxID=472368 RepID=A0A2Z7BUW6_9LAMI|nr:hypothetical protein F511_36557 [Dorcoceras hygrometricum]